MNVRTEPELASEQLAQESQLRPRQPVVVCR